MYIIIRQDRVYHAGDERSRTNPGHGYPAYTEEVQKVETFEDYKRFEDRVEKYTLEKAIFKAYKAEELKVTTKVVIDIT